MARRAQALAEAGLDRVNVSLDTVDRARFAAIARRDRLPMCWPAWPPPRTPGWSRSKSTRCWTQ
ncbi:hypothetical protein I553_4484 [Mycobacterium xenopi 4042]|uniref:Uncharacterized protein n=1 Tax=Mycobacterium xenopi 4042 TaxID=1299334 RepID=X8AE71_MYCXE|nr:hypothetical protein I553_4484 [Mycobacterium xenopi 4042]